MTLQNTLPRKRQASIESEITQTTNEPLSALPKLLSDKEVAQYLGISTAFLRRARSEGSPGGRTAGPPFIRLESFGSNGGRNGGRIMYPLVDADEWLMSLERKRVI